MNATRLPAAWSFPWVLLILVLFSAGCGPSEKSTNPFRVIKKAHPFGPPDEYRKEFYRALEDIATDGEHVFLSNFETGLIELDGDGNHVQTYGEPGRGPAFLTKVLGTAVTPDLVWIIDFKQRLLCFERGSGEFLYGLNLDIPQGMFYANFFRHPGTNTMLAVDRNLLLPMRLLVNDHNIATLFDDQGRIVKHIMDPDYKKIMEKDISTWRRTLWAYDDGFWYCAYMHGHRLLKFDADFNKVYDVAIDTPITRRYDGMVQDQISSGGNSFAPFFWDMDVFGDYVYLLAQFGIFQVGKVDGAFKRKIEYHYNADRPINGEIIYGPITFSTFAILNTGRVILAPNHPNDMRDDLFQGSIPDYD
ncbi:MAG: hypothetical protein QNK37_29060 [Acidobacteriota bacterium]|nr:hypothetical protein [Acidobacteriota bacterium]